MNNKKKILITLGSFGVIATPIVSSVSFAEKEAVQDWKDFYNQVNDVSKDSKALVNWSPEIETKLFKSTFYRTQSLNNKWNISNAEDIHAMLYALRQSKEFNNAEKIAIAKRIVSNQMAANIFDSFGFYGKTSTNEITSSTDIKISDPTKQGANLKVNNQEVKLVGATGENTTFGGLYKKLNEHQYSFSNQDILNYYLAVAAKSDEFKTLASTFAVTKSKFLFGTSGLSFKDALTSFYSYANALLERMSTDKLNVQELLKTSIFGALEDFGLSSSKNNEESYELFMHSPMANYLYPNGEAINRLEEFKREPDFGIKSEYLNGDLWRLTTMIDSFGKVSSPFLDKMLNNPLLKDKTQVLNAAIKFAKTLAEYSNNFTSDVQILVHNDPINGDSISIRSGHMLGIWDDITNSHIDIPYFILGDSNWDTTYGFKPFTTTYTKPENANKPQNVVVNNYLQIPLTEGESVLNIEPGAVMSYDHSEKFLMQAQLDFNNLRHASDSLWFSKRPTSNDEAVKYENWVVRLRSPEWTNSINSPVSGSAIYFYKGDKGNPIQNIKLFPELTVTLNDAVEKATRKVFSQINEKTGSFNFDPFASYSFEIKLLSVIFGKVYFNIYPDRHIDNLRFAGSKANFSYKIMAERQ